jgi:hypothetical protein
MSNTITSSVSSEDTLITNYYYGDSVASSIQTGLRLEENSSLSLGDNFVISIKELRACIKAMREIARNQYPEDFI